MKKSWVSVVESLPPDENPVSFMVLADLVIEEGDQEELARLLEGKVRESRAWWDGHEQDVMLDWINDGDNGRAVRDYRAILARIEVLRQVSGWVFAACQNCDGCHAEPGFECPACVLGFDFTRPRQEGHPTRTWQAEA